jgi:hypothetical protein
VRVDYAFVAEAADSQGGLFYVTRGGTDLFFMPRDFGRPLRLPALSFVIRLVGEPHEIGRSFPVTYSVIDQDGRSAGFSQEAEVQFNEHPIDATLTTAVIATFRFYGFPVPDFGTYLFEVRAGEERLAQVPFWVVPMEPQPGQLGQPGQPGQLA